MAFAGWLIYGRALDLPPDLAAAAGESRVPLLYGFMGSFVPVAFVILVLRLYSRWRFTGIGKDDVLVTMSFILYIGLVVATVFATKFGLGHHIWTITEEGGVLMQKCGFSSQVLYPPALCAIKLSIVFFFIRCLPEVHDRKPFLYGFAGFIFAEEAAFTIALFLQCRPLNFYWDKTVEGACFNQPAFYYTDAAFNMATDMVILSLPWVLFRKLNVSRRQRYTVVAICSLGVFTLISSVLRLPYLHDLNQSVDPTWSVVNIVIWTIAELGSAISLSSIPAVRPLYAHVFKKGGLKGGSNGSSYTASAKKPKTIGPSPFLNSIGSIADNSPWRKGVQMFSVSSSSDNQEKSQIVTEASGSEDHIVLESRPQFEAANKGTSIDKDEITVIESPPMAATKGHQPF